MSPAILFQKSFNTPKISTHHSILNTKNEFNQHRKLLFRFETMTLRMTLQKKKKKTYKM